MYIYIYMCVCVCMCNYIYIYIYIHSIGISICIYIHILKRQKAETLKPEMMKGCRGKMRAETAQSCIVGSGITAYFWGRLSCLIPT